MNFMIYTGYDNIHFQQHEWCPHVREPNQRELLLHDCRHQRVTVKQIKMGMLLYDVTIMIKALFNKIYLPSCLTLIHTWML